MSPRAPHPERRWDALPPGEAAEAPARDPVVVLPLGATEQHGPHLPLSTDCDIGEGILEAALAALEPSRAVYRLPMREVGVSPEHAGFPGTLTVSPAVLEAEVVASGAGLAEGGVRRLVIFNSHGGNRAVVDTAALRLRAEGGMLVVKAHWFRFPRPPDVDLPEEEWTHGLHGGAVETAMMLHLHPERVERGAVRRFPSLGEELAERLTHVGPEGVAPFAWMARDLNPQGVTGDASRADAGMGRRLVSHYAAVLAEVIRDAARFPLERLAPHDG